MATQSVERLCEMFSVCAEVPNEFILGHGSRHSFTYGILEVMSPTSRLERVLVSESPPHLLLFEDYQRRWWNRKNFILYNRKLSQIQTHLSPMPLLDIQDEFMMWEYLGIHPFSML